LRYHLVTLGCPKNVADSEKLERLLREAGHRPSSLAAAETVIVNTCGFIDAAKEQSINTILRLAMKKRPGQRLIVAGCLPELYAKELAKEIEQIDHLFGVEAWEEIAAVAGKSAPVAEAAPDEVRHQPPSPQRVSAYLKIADGCNARCGFCLIPRIKGQLHSTPIDSLVAEAQRLSREGVRELVLVAQDSTAYGRDLGMRDGLPDLLERLAEKAPDIPWIRVMYSYPGHISRRLVEAMANLPQVCHYLDIPLQHSSAAALRRMRRPSDIAEVRRTLERLRTAMPDIALRTTFLVGFPGETEGEFQGLLDFIREVRFDHIGAFPFSPQPGTEAARLPDQVPERVKRRRYRELMEAAQEISWERNREWVGRKMTVLVESKPGKTGHEGPLFAGRSYRDAPEVDGMVVCSGTATPGELRRVRITQALPYDLLAAPADSSAS
jgi:ribosomal protein S12 methylthiotransferase